MHNKYSVKPTIALFIYDPKCSVQSGNGVIRALSPYYNFKLFSKNIEVDSRIEYSQAPEFKAEVVKRMLLCAMSIASQKSTFECQAQKKPIKALDATADMNADATMMLVPTSSNFKVVAAREPATFVATVTSEALCA